MLPATTKIESPVIIRSYKDFLIKKHRPPNILSMLRYERTRVRTPVRRGGYIAERVIMTQLFNTTEQTTYEHALDIIRSIYEDLPFNRLLGFEVARLESSQSELRFSMKDELIGNYVHGILHGGVISAVLDTTGGLTATASVVSVMIQNRLDPLEIKRNIAGIGTIDMRADYLRPGKGKKFSCSGMVLRTGKKVAVTRMELKNDENLLIAVGTGTYMVG